MSSLCICALNSWDRNLRPIFLKFVTNILFCNSLGKLVGQKNPITVESARNKLAGERLRELLGYARLHKYSTRIYIYYIYSSRISTE